MILQIIEVTIHSNEQNKTKSKTNPNNIIKAITPQESKLIKTKNNSQENKS